jgi:hypothetical protein
MPKADVAARRQGLSGRATGSVIGAVFGLVYVEVNAFTIGEPGSLVVRIAAWVAFGTCLVAVGRGRGRGAASPGEALRLGARYWLVVAGEAVLLFGGWYGLNGPIGRPDAALPWVTLVVGVHFFALAVVFHARVHHLLGVCLTLCGAAGMALALGGASSSSVVVTAGICPGFVLLAFSLWGSLGAMSVTHTRAWNGSERTSGRQPTTASGLWKPAREPDEHQSGAGLSRPHLSTPGSGRVERETTDGRR